MLGEILIILGITALLLALFFEHLLKLFTIKPSLNTNLTIYYGSQTGTAFRFAKDLVQEAIAYGIKATVIDLAAFNVEDLVKERLAVFVVATYGNGGPSANAVKLYRWLNDNEECKLANMRFAVFGCGDRIYKHFNRMAKVVADRLELRGAVKICNTGTGNASDNIEQDFYRWKELFWKTLNTNFTSKPSIVTHHNKELEYDLTTQQYMKASNTLITLDEYKILSIRELRDSIDEGSTLKIDIEVSNDQYSAGDTFAIFAENEERVVNRLAEFQGWDLDEKVVYKTNRAHPFPRNITLREALIKFCDLTGLLSYFSLKTKLARHN
jgi:NADPH-ferrihemoprotein reductase